MTNETNSLSTPDADLPEAPESEPLIEMPDGLLIGQVISQGEPVAESEVAESVEEPIGQASLIADADLDLSNASRALEAALLSATEPLSVADLRRMFQPDLGHEVIQKLLAGLQEKWLTGSVRLMRLASGWRFQTAADLQPYIERLRETRPPRYSRAVLETLAVIVYRQPVTRGDIEEIRGVAVSSQIIKTLEGRGWIDTVGYRETPGRPALFATTKKMLDDLGLRSLTELPPLSELEGVLDLVHHAEEVAGASPGEPETSGHAYESEDDGTAPPQSAAPADQERPH